MFVCGIHWKFSLHSTDITGHGDKIRLRSAYGAVRVACEYRLKYASHVSIVALRSTLSYFLFLASEIYEEHFDTFL